MGSANRVQVTFVRETTLGITPNTPRMRTARITKEALSYEPDYIDSDELRSDRMNADSIPDMIASDGSVDFELSYPDDNTWVSEVIRSACMSSWVNTPVFDNDGTADSVVTDAGTVANTYAVAAGGAAVKVGHLVRATGFTNPANNQIFPATASTGTTIVGAGLGLTAEAVPPAAAKLKVIGFAGAAGDITAAAGGLASTTLDFTTLGLNPGQWLKIDSTTAAFGFATPANNDWVRVSGAVTAHAIPLDNLPVGWSVDAGAAKTIRVYFGDQIKNGVALSGMSQEKGFLDQAVPSYILHKGMCVNTLSFNIVSRDKVTCTATFLGMGGSQGTVTVDAVPDVVTTGQVMAANANCGRIGEGGAKLTSPNWSKQIQLQINNNLQTIEAADSVSPVGISYGDCTVSGSINTYFGDNTILAKVFNGTASSIGTRLQKNNQALVISVPREVLRSGSPQAQGKSTQVMLNPTFKASVDTFTNAHVLFDRLEFYN